VALAECCFSSLNSAAIGAEVNLEGSLPPPALLFSESPSRIIVSFANSSFEAIKAIADRRTCPFTVIGSVNGARLRIDVHGENAVDVGVNELEEVWATALAKKLGVEAIAAGTE
jgi:phosphoribosylformylglycinamidine synthase